MSTWLIDWLGSGQLREAFLWITLLPLPLWLLLLFFGRHPWVRRIAHPLILPLLLTPLWGYVLYTVVTGIGAPALRGTGYFETREFLSHPLMFLVLWAQLQVVNLFVGTVIYREGLRTGIDVRVEILLCWLLAPLALVVCAVRVGTKRTFFRW